MHIRIRRSGSNCYLAGVLGGLAEHFDWNAGVLRALFIFLSIPFFYTMPIIYLFLWLLMEKPDYHVH
ncbi:PspC domain-containing protein [Lactobacillus sp. DCY120]|uniref:PspC domain-containing protein n=1 Tax=Bombilactobacillus apium TaxID=2675299 RepID=A0A850R519_9LACO|nr:PspC domain-containing protein [Bombilactobacillus apium]NVY95625.1 PspC domain-containing protein [Bombilactobacillus apium]